MRLSAIAEEAVSRGIECCFYGSLGNINWLINRLAKLGIRFIDSNVEQDFEIQASDVLILDSYVIPTDNPLLNSYKWFRKVLIADNTTLAYKSDLVFYIGEEASREKFTGIIFAGYEYMPIRRFVPLADKDVAAPEIRSVVVSGGGTDPFGFSRAIAEAICGREGFERAVFFNEDDRSISSLDSRFKVKPFGSELDTEIQKSSLVFTTPSTLAFEVLSLNIPLGVGCATENQKDFFQYFLKHGLASEIAIRQNSNWKINIDNLDFLLERPVAFSQNPLDRTENLKFNGSERIVELILDSI